MEYGKVNSSLLVTASDLLSQSEIMDLDLKSDLPADEKYNSDGSVKVEENKNEVTVVATNMPIYLFTPNDDVVQAYSATESASMKADQAAISVSSDSQQLLKDDAANLNTFPSCISLEIPYFETVSQSAQNVITLPTSTVSAVNVSSTSEAPTDLCEEMIRSFVVGGGSTLRKQMDNIQEAADQSDRIDVCHETISNVPVSNAIISTNNFKDPNSEQNINKQVIIQIEDDQLLDESTTAQPSRNQYHSPDDDVSLANSDDDNEILVTFLRDKADMGNQSVHPITTSLTAEEILQSQPVLDLDCEVVKEIVDVHGVVQRRVITTQTKPLRAVRRPKKEKPKKQGSGSVSDELGGSEVDVQTVAEELSPTVNRQYKCTRCGLRFSSSETWEFHVKCHTTEEKQYKCFQCDFTSQFWAKMHQHLFTHGVKKPHKCPQCSFTCVNKSDLSSHMFVHSKTKNWLCHKCNRFFKHRRNMVAHLRICGGVDAYGKQKKSNQAQSQICKICKKELSNKRNLVKHMEIHTDIRPFVCDLCGHSTRLKESLIMHKRLHTGEKPFKCDQCDYCTPDKSSLRRHKRRHTNEKPHCCSFCNYKSIQKHCLDTHIRSKHTGEQFVCGLCHYTTHDRYALNQHFKIHQNGHVATNGVSTGTAIINIDGNVLTTIHDVEATVKRKPIEEEGVMLTNNDPALGEKQQEKLSASTSETVQPLERETTVPTSNNGMGNLYVVSSNVETRMVELNGEEEMLLQQIQEPGDLVFLQESGEIVIKKTDGRIVIIQQEEPK